MRDDGGARMGPYSAGSDGIGGLLRKLFATLDAMVKTGSKRQPDYRRA